MADQSPSTASGPSRLEKADAILKSWQRFNGIYKSKRYIIENRWLKMKQERRKTLLGDSWPAGDLPENHRPDLDGPAIWRAKGQEALAMPYPMPRMPDKWHLLMPDYNKTDLGDNTAALLHLLDSRADVHPGEFARLDYSPLINNALQEECNQSIAITVKWKDAMKGDAFAYLGKPFEETDTDEYGSIIEVEDRDHFKTLLYAGYLAPRDASRIMDIQERIYGFLERLCDNITATDKKKAFSVKGEGKQTFWKRKLDFDPDQPDQADNLQLYLEQQRIIGPYGHPHEKDWDFLSAHCGFHLRQAQDTLRRMREDPTFFYEYLYEVKDSSSLMLRYGDRGDPHPYRSVEDNPAAVSNQIPF